MTDVATETAALLERDADFAAEAATGRDVDKVLDYWSADAVVMAPGQPPIIGRDALRAYVEGSYQIPGFSITWEATGDPEFSAGLDMAYLWGRNTVTFDDPEGNRVVSHGRAITVWRREPDGQWRCVADVWNDEPQA